MIVKRRITRAIWMIRVGIALHSSPAFGQSRVRVINDHSLIWRRDAPVVATSVEAGTLLDVVGRAGEQYVVVIPADTAVKARWASSPRRKFRWSAAASLPVHR